MRCYNSETTSTSKAVKEKTLQITSAHGIEGSIRGNGGGKKEKAESLSWDKRNKKRIRHKERERVGWQGCSGWERR